MTDLNDLWITINKKNLTPEKIKQAINTAIEEAGEEVNYARFEPKDFVKTHIEKIEEDGTLFVIAESDVGYISINVKLDDDDIIKLIQIFVKRLNKLKTIIEGLKN